MGDPPVACMGEVAAICMGGAWSIVWKAESLQSFVWESGLTDLRRGLAQLHEAARAGSAQAQHELGRRYEAGDGVQKDRNAALLFLKLAADQGLAAAQNSLAEILCARLARVAIRCRETIAAVCALS